MRILVIGRYAALMDQILEQLRRAGFDAMGATSAAEALREMRVGAYTAIAIVGGVEPASRARFHREAAKQDPAPAVLDVSGPDTLLPRLKAIRESLPRS